MTKKLIAAFLWDSSNRSISFMFIDGKLKLLDRPRKYDLRFLTFQSFRHRAEKVVKDFFAEITEHFLAEHYSDVLIEYKIVHLAKDELAYYYQPTPETRFVRKIFLHWYALAKSVVLPMRLAKQLRTRLKRPHLDEFKKCMRELAIVAAKRNNAYQFHLWILATHATKTNYKKVLKRLTKKTASLDLVTVH